jgi:hypothetical protein
MGFSIKLAPGVRVRASSRGVRTSLGPRVARVHVGAGRTGVSTGVGPVGLYTSVGGSRRRTTSTGSVNRQLAAAARQQAQQEKAAEADRLRSAFEAIYALHRESFETARPPVAASAPEPPGAHLRRLYRAQARKATRVTDRAGRRQALTDANQRSASEVETARADLAKQTEAHQRQLDAWWAALIANDPDVVLPVLNEAFLDNEAAASAVGIEGGEASILVLVPPVSDLPDRKPAVTQAGNLSLKKLTKTETADIYKQLVCGHLVVTLRETFAVAPGLDAARIVAIRAGATDAYGKSAPEVLSVARCTRDALSGVLWDQVTAVQVINDVCTDKILIQKGVTGALHPIPLSKEPDLRALLDAVEMDELGR